MLKNQKGITLVALVVTIVVLIILATISISIALNGGIADKAQKAGSAYQQEERKWNDTEQNVMDFVHPYLVNADLED